MKKRTTISRLFWGTLVLITILFMASCNKTENDAVNPTVESISNTIFSNAITNSDATYTTSPATNIYTSYPKYQYSGSCGTFQAGNLKSKVISANGDTFTIRIENVSGQPFGGVGFAYINANDVCPTSSGSNQAGKLTITSSMTNYWYFDITIRATFSTGVVNFYPSVIIPSKNIKWCGEPIKITAQLQSLPYSISTTQTGIAFGQLYGYVNNVPVYSNSASSSYNSSLRSYYNGNDVGVKWQCVEFVRRYYLQAKNKSMGAGYDAKSLFSHASSWGMVAYSNGGANAPQVGDVLCFGASNSNAAGHVAIIMEVTNSDVKVAQQNVGTAAHIRYSIGRNGNTINGVFGSACQGWIR